MSTVDPYRCDDCGHDLTLTAGQVDHLFRYGNPVTRPSCPANADGLHRVSDEQMQRHRVAELQAHSVRR